jgi:hypothetical protein
MLDTLLKQLNMVRLSVGATAAIMLIGCTGLIQGKDDPSISPEERAARDKWVNGALPAFQSATCTTCHAGSMPDVAFLAGMSDLDARQTLLGFNPQVVNIDAPQSSRVLTKGAHAGPALDAQYVSPILEWIQAEAAAAGASGGGSTTLTTQPFTPLMCTSGTSGSATCPINHVSLVDVGMSAATPIDLTGAEITFVVQPLSNSMYVTDLTLTAGTNGIYIEHPLVVYIPPMGGMCSDGTPGPCPDNLDRFFAVKMDEMAAQSAQIDGGTAAFTGFAPVSGSQLQLTFKVVDVYRADSGTGSGGGGSGATGGCKVPLSTSANGANSFQTMVVPKMTTGGQPCSSCHMGQNGNATSAMDITGITSTDTTMITSACNQVRTRVNFQTPAMSGVELAPDPAGDGAHPFKLSTTSNPTLGNFDTALNNWIQAEATAP